MAPGDGLNGPAAAWPEIAFKASPVRSLGVVAGSVAFVVLGAAMVCGYIGPIQPWSMPWLAGWAALIFFGVCAAFGIKQAMTRGAIVTIGPRGVRDVRISPDWIPWAAIAGVAEHSVQGTRFLMLRIDPAFEATMSLTPLARWGKPANAALGYHGYGIAAVGLKGGFKALKSAVEDGLVRAHGG